MSGQDYNWVGINFLFLRKRVGVRVREAIRVREGLGKLYIKTVFQKSKCFKKLANA